MADNPSTCHDLRRDIGLLLSLARVCGCWPLSDASISTGNIGGRREVAWDEMPKEEGRDKDPRARKDGIYCRSQTMSWRSYPPYMVLCVLATFSFSLVYHGFNTYILFNDDKLSSSEMLTSLPWLGSIVVPWTSGVLTLVRARKASVFLDKWRAVEHRLRFVMACRGKSHHALFTLGIYVLMGVSSLGVLTYQYFQQSSSSVYYGNLVPAPWSLVLLVVQHATVLLTWAGLLVPEAFLIIAAHHLSYYYKSLNDTLDDILHKLFAQTITPAAGVDNFIHNPGVYLYNKQNGTGYHQYPESQEWHMKKLREVWSMYEEVDEVLAHLNAFLSPLVLVNYAAYTIMICTLLIPVLKSRKIISNIGYLGNVLFYLFRTPVLFMGQACVHDQASSTQLVVSRGHARLAISGLYLTELEAFIARLSASTNHQGISAWGFFCVRRESMLTFISILASYVVIMLQS